MYELLDKIEKPEDVKKLSVSELTKLASELRHFIIDRVSQNGGHLAPNLGTVELTLALYSVFHFPQDKLVWDVGHQAYTHKILTGRKEAFATLRKKGGITGFPNRFESPYDAFGVGHASTSISAALGMAIARDAKGEHNQVIAVIGDGALTGGESFEALNNAGDLGKKLIVILNDNEMSIDANVGAMSEYLSRIRMAPQYARAKRDMGNLLMSIPHIGGKVYKTASHLKDGVRSALVPGSIFEEMGFHYVGPIDGHNIGLLEEVLQRAKEMEGPILIHIHTIKGKGYIPAEKAPENSTVWAALTRARASRRRRPTRPRRIPRCSVRPSSSSPKTAPTFSPSRRLCRRARASRRLARRIRSAFSMSASPRSTR